jgi:hypothetical protein
MKHLILLLIIISAASCTNTSITKKDFSVYTTEDIIHVVDETIFFESSDTMFFFKSDLEQYTFLEKLTAKASTVEGYAGDLDYNIRNGYIYARTVYNEDEQYTDLVYVQDSINILISTFNNVEKIYNPVTKSTEYDHYSVD